MSTYQMSPVISTHLYLPRGTAPAEPVCVDVERMFYTHSGQHAFGSSPVEYGGDTIIMLQFPVLTYLPSQYALKQLHDCLQTCM